jgi:glycosyltransferase involved in cell wall biosynthesis
VFIEGEMGMKIAILGTRGIPSGYSGYEGFVEELGTRLVEMGHSVTVYAHSSMFKDKPKVYRGIRIIYMPCLEGKNTSQFSHSLLSTINVLFKKTDIVFFCNASNGPFGLLLKIFGKRSVINVDGLEWLRPKWGKLAKKYFKFGALAATKFFDRVITDAKGMQQYYFDEFDAKTTNIAYGAYPQFSEKPELIKQFNLEPNEYYLIASRLVPDNNADIIIEAFVKSKSKRLLAIAGGVPYKNEFVDKLHRVKDERVVFLGHIDDQKTILELHLNAYGYLHGHEFGGTNPALLKALSCGNFVIALDTVFNREVLDEGKYGVFFEKSIENLIEKIDRYDADESLVKRFRESARQRIIENYSWEKITDEYLDVFNNLKK